MISFLAKAHNGELHFGSPYNASRLKQHLLENEGKIFTVEQHIENRTGQQNRFYWKYLELIELETGNNATTLHEYFKRTLLPPKFQEIKVNGEIKEFKIPASTTELSKLAMGEYLDKISALTGIQVPDPTLLDGYIQG
jgi:hypothetical protein